MRRRLARDGPNEVAHEKPLPGWLHLWHCYKNPFNLLLTVLAVVSYLTQDAKATIVIAAMVVWSTVIRFVQEGRSNQAAERLKAMVSNTATVLRRLPLPVLQEAAAPLMVSTMAIMVVGQRFAAAQTMCLAQCINEAVIHTNGHACSCNEHAGTAGRSADGWNRRSVK